MESLAGVNSSGQAPAAAEIRCDLTELFVAQCAHCRRLPDPPAYGRWYRARTAAACSACGDDIDPGDRVRIRTDRRGIVCEDCGADHV